MKKCIPLWLFVLLIILSGCEKNNPKPAEEVLAELTGKCLKGKVVAGKRCTSAVYVQLLNASTGTISTYEGKEYKNIILIGNFPKDSGLKTGDSFYFTIATALDLSVCTKVYPCTMEQIPSSEEPYPVAIKACLETLSIADCAAK